MPAGHSSDGDARRFLLQLHECRLLAVEEKAAAAAAAAGSAAPGTGPTTLGGTKNKVIAPCTTRREYLGLSCPAFPDDLRCAVDYATVDGVEHIVGIRGLNNQDPIHNCKKGDAVTRSATKDVRIGKYHVDAGLLLLLKTPLKGMEVPLGGVTDAAIRRKDRQNFKHVAERQSVRVTTNLRTIQEKGLGDTLGLAVVYEALREFMLIWFSETASLESRVESAGYVTALLTRLKLALKSKGKTVLRDFWPNQSYRHIVWGCTVAVWICMIHSRQCKGKAAGEEPMCGLHLSGSDCLERFFANLGGFGKFASWQRNFSFGDAVDKTRKMNHFAGLHFGDGSVTSRKAHSKQEMPVDKMEPRPEVRDPNRNMKTPFSDEEYAAAYQKGADRALAVLKDIPGTEALTKEANVRIDIPDTYAGLADLKGTNDGTTQESLAGAFSDMFAALQTEASAEAAADPTAPDRDAPRDSDNAASESVARTGSSGTGGYERTVPEAVMTALSDPNDYTDGYVPLRNAIEAKRLHLASAGHSVQLQEEQVNIPRVLEKKVLAVLNAGGSATPPAGWTGDKWCSGERGLGYVCTAGNCCLEAFLVGYHNLLINDRGAGVAVFRGSIPTGNGGFVDHDIHFDPRVDPYGGDHPGRPFLSAVESMRRMMVAHVLTPGWWEQNKDTATAYYGSQPPVAAAQIAWDDVTIDTVIESLSTDREWFGDYEIGILAAVTDTAIAVYDCPPSSAPTKQEREDEVFDTPTQRLGAVFGKNDDPLVQLVYVPKETHFYAVVGAKATQYTGVLTAEAAAASGAAVSASSSSTEADDGEVNAPSQEALLASELYGLLHESAAWDKAGSKAGSDMLIDVGGGKQAWVRTVLKKLWQRSQEQRGESQEVSKDRLRKIAQNAATAAAPSTVAPAVEAVDYSNDVLGPYADVVFAFEVEVEAAAPARGKNAAKPKKTGFRMYVGQVDKMVAEKAGGGTKVLFESSVPFDEVPDDLLIRCTWYRELETLPDGSVVFGMGVKAGADDDSKFNDKRSLIGVARLDCRRAQAPATGVISGEFTMDKAQHQELTARLGRLKPKAQAKAAEKAAAATKSAAAAARAAAQSAAPDGRQCNTTSRDRGDRASRRA